MRRIRGEVDLILGALFLAWTGLCVVFGYLLGYGASPL